MAFPTGQKLNIGSYFNDGEQQFLHHKEGTILVIIQIKTQIFHPISSTQ